MEERIIVKTEDVPITKTRKGFLKKYFENTPATYDHGGNQTCDAMLNRSVSDLLIMTRERFPKTSLNAVVRILHELNNDEVLKLTYCPSIKKVVTLAACRMAALKFKEDEDNFITKVGRECMDHLGIDGLTLNMIEDIKNKEVNG